MNCRVGCRCVSGCLALPDGPWLDCDDGGVGVSKNFSMCLIRVRALIFSFSKPRPWSISSASCRSSNSDAMRAFYDLNVSNCGSSKRKKKKKRRKDKNDITLPFHASLLPGACVEIAYL